MASAKTASHQVKYSFFPSDTKQVMAQLGDDALIDNLKKMLLVRNFETRAEGAYLQGKIGGFFHSYIGQEAIQTAATAALGPDNWWITSYRCHALALLLGVTPNEIMAELYGRATGNAKGRGGSMHLFSDRLLGGFGIVTGQVPIATGAAFSIKYLKKEGEVAVCFLGDGAVAQGALHESLNLASLWGLPCIYVIENNKWGMGTAVSRALCIEKLAEGLAPSYGLKGYTFDGMDFFNCYAGFKHIQEQVLAEGHPALVEVITERFKGHSISDPGLYRTKEQLKGCMEGDPITRMYEALSSKGIIDEERYKALDKECKAVAVAAMEYADASPWPEVSTLEEDVFKE